MPKVVLFIATIIITQMKTLKIRNFNHDAPADSENSSRRPDHRRCR